MDMERANEIFNSPSRIPVHYKGKSIWIAELNPQSHMVKIKDDLFSEEVSEVPVTELVE
ncbi:H-type small acid-soluble spore protein [Alkaliphilus peptidifermentans]|uniref:Small acid-soluble spore protein, H-type n=1 Tax=Alkaliphilus peptidifermentans DSM 18978 TaxID=1120976 RepID=A0A1G5J2B2_9FIRM|nr:H-type small acid-soluble spore protein [Alkaliphilus peptidifermentans]SCY82485.1 small acid-soluble spore protein, H-type [Alkaliphilus peptidifermentans DSM 18978]